MHPSSTIYAVFLLISGAISAFVSGIVWRRRSTPGAGALLVVLLGTLTWSFTYALHWLASSASAKLFWLEVTYIGVVTIPAALFVFALQFTQRFKWFSGWKIGLLAIEPLLTLLLMATDPFHGLFFGGKQVSFQSRIYDGGPWFWIHLIYSYALVVISLFLLFSVVLRPNRLYRTQTRLILAGALFPILGNLIGFTALNPFQGLDLTPIAFTLTGVFFALSLLRYRLLDLIPIGRDVLVEKMDEGMLLLDDQRRVVDINSAARRLLNLPPGSVVGKTAEEALVCFPDILSLMQRTGITDLELALGLPSPRYLQVQVMPVSDAISRLSGTLVICHDITERKMAERDLKSQLQQIQELQESLREQAIRDTLTGLFNRRYLQETLPRELARAAREAHPLSLVVLDIDHFKELNDTYGHLLGDSILQCLSQVLVNGIREGDIASRIGGDEFLLVLVDTPAEIACSRVGELSTLFSSSEIEYDGRKISATFSAGIAAFPQHATSADRLYQMADLALYRAKTAGRNRCMVFSIAGAV